MQDFCWEPAPRWWWGNSGRGKINFRNYNLNLTAGLQAWDELLKSSFLFERFKIIGNCGRGKNTTKKQNNPILYSWTTSVGWTETFKRWSMGSSSREQKVEIVTVVKNDEKVLKNYILVKNDEKINNKCYCLQKLWENTGRALVETEPVRYQLEEIHLSLDKEHSEKVVILVRGGW